MKASRPTKETIINSDFVGIPNRVFPDFRIGDTIDVATLVVEGDKERTQMFTGDVIAFHNNGIGSTFTVRRVGAGGVGVERIFPYYSPNISDIKIKKRGKVRRAKLFYVRRLVGKAARLEEQILTKEQQEALLAAGSGAVATSPEETAGD